MKVDRTLLSRPPHFLPESLAGVLLRVSLVLVLISFYVFSTFYNIESERRLIMNDIERISRVTAKSAQVHTHAVFDATVHTLTALRSDLQFASSNRTPQVILDDHFFYSPYLRTTLLLDTEGFNIASNFREIVGTDGVGYTFFEVHRNNPHSEAFTGDIIVGRISRSAHFVSSLALRDDDGSFEGVVAAAYELSYFKDLFAQLTPGDHYAVALYHRDEGLVVASDSQISQGSLPTSSRLPLHLPDYNSQFRPVQIPQEREMRVRAFSLPLNEEPFYIATFANIDNLLANHHESNTAKFRLMGLFVISVLFLTIMLEAYNASRRRVEFENLKLEDELRHAQKMEALGTMAGGLAHDFNNLLSAIIGFSELARERLQNALPADAALEQVLLAGRRAESMVDRILTFSQRTETKRAPFELKSVVSEILELMKISIPSSVSVSRNIDIENSWVLGDSNQIHQMVMNLCMNAVQAMPEGGVLDVSLGHESVSGPGPRHPHRPRPGDYLKLTVSDTGVGIPTHVQEKIFDPFFTTRHLEKGSGLGLSIVHGIVQEHDGAISVSSVVGQGACFTIWLPIIDPPAETEDPKRADSVIDGEGRVAMFVDDDEAIVSLAEERLASFGFEPHAFIDSREALEHLRSNAEHIDLLITDYSMPNISGLELATAARRIKPDLKVILITGFGPKEVIDAATKLGVCEIVHKPIRARKLAAAISRCLSPGSG